MYLQVFTFISYILYNILLFIDIPQNPNLLTYSKSSIMAAKHAKVSEHANENIKTFAMANYHFSILINSVISKILEFSVLLKLP